MVFPVAFPLPLGAAAVAFAVEDVESVVCLPWPVAELLLLFFPVGTTLVPLTPEIFVIPGAEEEVIVDVGSSTRSPVIVDVDSVASAPVSTVVPLVGKNATANAVPVVISALAVALASKPTKLVGIELPIWNRLVSNSSITDVCVGTDCVHSGSLSVKLGMLKSTGALGIGINSAAEVEAAGPVYPGHPGTVVLGGARPPPQSRSGVMTCAVVVVLARRRRREMDNDWVCIVGGGIILEGG